MPSTSAKQAKFMKAVANNPKFAKKVGVPQSVGKDFEMADKKKGRKFGSGGAAKKPMMESDRKPIDMRRAILGSDKDIVARGNRTPYEPIPKKGPEKPKQKLGRMGEKGYAKGGKAKKYALGGPTAAPSATPLKDASPKTSGLPGTSGVQMAAKPAAPTPSATPLKDASAKTSGLPGTGSVQMAAKPTVPVSAVSTARPTGPAFDRNAAYQSFNSQARNFLNQGVPKSEIIKQQGILRALQMNNASDNAAHQRALADAMSAMQSMIPKKKAAKGGTMKSSDKAGRALVKKSADTKGRAMKYAAGGLAAGHKSANGIAKKGKTKAMQVKMNKGGACYAKGGSVRGIDGIAMKGKTRCKGAR